jgi:predicted HAD superfamily phosphohydrolase YqeG
MAPIPPRREMLCLDVENAVIPYGVDPRRAAETLQAVLSRLAGVRPGMQIYLISNSPRVLSKLAASANASAVTISRARKPFTRGVASLRDRSGEVDVCGDQPLTDGLLAWRLGAPFLYLAISEWSEPLWPALLRRVGRVVSVAFLRPRRASF